MARLILLIAVPIMLALAGLFGSTVASGQQSAADPIPYEEVVSLDAERLAEGGMIEVYDEIEPVIVSHGGRPDTLQAHNDAKTDRYSIAHRGITYPVSGGDISVAQGWGNAAAVFFEIVNRQMEGSEYRFYALNHGNDLQGVFLTDKQYAAARAFHRRGADTPFRPTREAPMFGMPDDRP